MITYETRYESNESVNRSERYTQILQELGDNEMTAKEISVGLYRKGIIPTSDRNYVSPRLTEMAQEGIVEPIRKKKCQFTGKTVAVWKNCEGKYGR